ncbi:MAG: succinyl-diaminopimelate desuccinylase [Rhodospirillaceae bacterium]|nr:succinyl-diaminopimelate desuccinylase [Rhodospirillaceae bacterium]MCA8934023.1 succinyl-diaminopimelate desuccinylase [Rhodospirillaceae bacterium]
MVPPCNDPVALAQALVRCPSVTPADAGALDVVQRALEPLGFTCWRLPFSEPGVATVDNLFARRGTDGPHLCFAGHTDVVPPGDPAAWRFDPFSGELADGAVWGRGAADMKGSIASFLAAVAQVDAADGPPSLSLLITGDEEADAINGTTKVLGWMAENGHLPDAALVGEPTNPTGLGEAVKIGRRGSLNAWITVTGRQGHTAYPAQADNAASRMAKGLAALLAEPVDSGTAHFDASNLEVATIDVGNPAANVIPAKATATVNIRFNDTHTGAGLSQWLRETFEAAAGPAEIRFRISAESFLTPPGALSDLVAEAVMATAGRTPVLSTSGGTSDARFIKDYCPVVEYGGVNATIHQVDEHALIEHLIGLRETYAAVLTRFARTWGAR